MKLMRAFYAKYNIVNLPGGNTGVQLGGWFRRGIKSVADLNRFKFRPDPFAGKVLEPCGVIPQSIGGADLHPALGKGTFDGLEWIGPDDQQKLGFNKVALFYHCPGWWEVGTEIDFYFNSKAKQSEARPVGGVRGNRRGGGASQPFDDGPVRRQEPCRAQATYRPGHHAAPLPASGFERRFQVVAADLRGPRHQQPRVEKICPDWLRFLGDENAWFRTTEGMFDRFMQQQKP